MVQEKAKINNIEDFNGKFTFVELPDGSSCISVKGHEYNLPVREERPIRNAFTFGQDVPEANVEEFIGYLRIVSSPSFGIVIKKLSRTARPTVIITVTGEEDSLELWYKNVEVLYEFYKNF